MSHDGLAAAFREALVLLLAGLVFALAANQVSPRGLSLTRNYFPAGQPVAPSSDSARSTNAGVAPPLVGSVTGRPARTNEADRVGARLAAKGLQWIEGKEAQELYRDPRYEQELIIFVDARDDRHYGQGHIPGAYQFDRYYPQNHLPTVVPACLNATKVVVYCTGGDCEDSEFSALTLIEAGVPKERIFVYIGGITEWVAKSQLVETGERKSGKLQLAKP